MKNIKFIIISTISYLMCTFLLSFGLNALLVKIFMTAFGFKNASDLEMGVLWVAVGTSAIAIGGFIISVILGFVFSLILKKRWNVKWYFIPISFVLYLLIIYGGLRFL